MPSPNENKTQSTMENVIFDYSTPGSVDVTHSNSDYTHTITYHFNNFDDKMIFYDFVAAIIDNDIPFSCIR